MPGDPDGPGSSDHARIPIVTAPGGKAEKYARRERERRFLLAALPARPASVRTARMTDRYLIGTRVRLRCAVESTVAGTDTIYKLTQKIPSSSGEPGVITTLYLSEAEYDVFLNLPALVLTKTRHSIPPFGIDVFDPPLDGLLLAEIEFDSDQAEDDFLAPPWAVAEVTADARFTGGRLVRTDAAELRSWLEEYGLSQPWRAS